MPKWTPEVDAKLLAAIVKTSDAKFDLPAIAALMTVEGDECTVKALNHRMARLKQVAKETWPDDDAVAVPAATITAPKTPRKRKSTAKDAGEDAAADEDDNANGGSTGKKRKTTVKKEREGPAEGSEEAAVEATPSTKGKGRGRPKKAVAAKVDTAVAEQKVKTEDDADEEGKATETVTQGENGEADGEEAPTADNDA